MIHVLALAEGVAAPPASDSPRVPRLQGTATLEPILSYWRGVAQDDQHALQPFAQIVLEKVAAVPELAGPLVPGLLEKHRSLTEMLLSCVFASSLQRFSFAAIATPGSFDFHWSTPRFQRELLDEHGRLRLRVMLDGMPWADLQELFQHLMIVRNFYGMEVNFDKSIVLEDRDPVTGTTRHFQMRAHFDHMLVTPPAVLPELSERDRIEIQENLNDLSVWRRLVRADLFRAEGLVVYEALEISEEMTLSAIKETLVATGSLVQPERFRSLQRLLGQLLKVEGLALEIGARHLDRVIFFNGALGTDLSGCTLDDECAEELREWKERFLAGQVIVIRDLDHPGEDACEPTLERAQQLGHKSMLTIPLVLEDTLVGLLSLSAPEVGALHALMPTRLREILPQVAWAVKRALDNIERRVQAVMKESFTAIHPAVEWRFQAQALEIVRGQCESHDLLFPNVYPLFGVSDVRNSTYLRNRAIQADLKEQLVLAQDVLRAACEARSMSYLHSREYSVRRHLEGLDQELQSGDESRISEFFKYEFEPLCDRLSEYGSEVREAVEKYRASLDPRLGILHRRRRDYEESMATVRDTVVDCLNRAQREAQAVYPHYFELNKTDGVDHTIYLGACMHPEGLYDPLYLKNLRLWQLETMLEVVAATRDISSSLPMALETAHLLLVQDAPLSLRYGLEEKHFDVDGAYNARYEILKKRIDKAEVRETGQRLTQPGRLAIVYSHRREWAEYNDYLQYLKDVGCVEGEIEDLELSPLQDVQGLRALRVIAGRCHKGN